MKKVCSICQEVFSGIGVAAVALLLINAVAAPTEVAVPTLSEDDPLMLAASGERDTLPTYQIKAWDLPKKMDFAGESVPLQIQMYVSAWTVNCLSMYIGNPMDFS